MQNILAKAQLNNKIGFIAEMFEAASLMLKNTPFLH